MAENNEASSTKPQSSAMKLQSFISNAWPGDKMIRSSKELVARLEKEPFAYEGLPGPTHIRLLYIESAPEKDIVRCNLREVDLELKPRYTALSYRWEKEKSLARQFVGNIQWQALLKERSSFGQTCDEYLAKKAHGQYFSQSEPSHEDGRYLIFCNGRRSYVQANLYDALIQLRKEEPAAYWIDAICINQHDDNEKSAQIQLMGRIYEIADKVVVWLGQLPTLLQPVMESLIKSDQNEALQKITYAISDKSDPILVAKRLAIFTWLLTREWFRRAWVIQEYCFAREPIFLLASFKLTENAMKNHLSSCSFILEEDDDKGNIPVEFKEAISKSKIELVQLLDSTYTATVPVNTLIQGILKMMQSRGVFANGKRWALHQWLEVMKGRGAKDVRDFIFAGISLIDPKTLIIDQKLQLEEFSQAAGMNENRVVGANRSNTRVWSAMTADYAAKPAVVLLNLSACILTGYGWERLFYHTLRFRYPPNSSLESEMPLSENPSWVLDPSISTSRVLESAYMFNKYFSPLGSTSTVDANPKISPDGRTLFLTASKLDEITDCVPTKNLGDLLKDDGQNKTPVYDALLSLIDFAACKVPSAYPHVESSGLQALLKVLVSYVYFLNRSKPPMDRESLTYPLSTIIGRAVRNFVKAVNSSPDAGDWQAKKERLLLALIQVRNKHPEETWGSNLWSGPDLGAEDMISLVGTMLEADTDGPPEKEAQLPKDVKDKMVAQILEGYLSTTGMIPLKYFTTEKGYLGMGPAWLQEGDSIFLIPGGSTPMIFAHMDDVLRRKIVHLRRRVGRKGLDGKMPKTEDVEKQVSALEARIGRRDAYQLVGETYVEGVMQGEVAGSLEREVQRMEIV